MICATALTVCYQLRPDDLDWVDEERKRAAAAKARIEAGVKELVGFALSHA